jgi:putative ABC transport system ATP-binding protein
LVQQEGVVPTDVIIRAENVNKIYQTAAGEVHALKSINWEVKRGEAIALMGPSGCGKTTLLNLIGSMDRPSSGGVFVDGRDITQMSEREAEAYRLRKVGFIFQFFNLIPTLSAMENLEMPMIIAGVDKKARKERAEQLLDTVGLLAKGHKRPEELSGGEQQRVATCIALVNDPDIVLADEPTGNLDAVNLGIISRMLVSLATERGKTVIVTSHDPVVVGAFPKSFRMRDGNFEAA